MMDSTTVQVPVKDAVALVDYLLNDEQQHFLGYVDGNDDEEAVGHIFMSVCPLAVALGFEVDDEALAAFNRLRAAAKASV
jgi:hypothetical protein